MGSRIDILLGIARVALASLAVTPGLVHAEFAEVSLESGVSFSVPSWGAQIVDMDSDGDLDIFTAHHYFTGIILTNDGTGAFSPWGLPQIIQFVGDRHGYLWVDLDGDDLLEIVCSHGGSGGCGCNDDGNELWQGIPGGMFTPVLDAGGMIDPEGRGRAFSAGDIDGDGDLDLFHAKAPLLEQPNSLYRNDGGLSFTDVAAAWGVAGVDGPVASLFADVDNDGDPDLLLAGDEFDRPTTYFRNDGGSFVDMTAAVFDSLPVVSWADWGDLENDGDLDLLVAEGHEGVFDTWQQDGTNWWFFTNHRFGDDGVDVFEFDTPGDDGVARFRVNGSLLNEFVFLGPSQVNPSGSTVTLDDTWVGEPSFAPGVDEGLYCWRESAGGRWKVHVSAPSGTYGNYAGTVESTVGVTSPSASQLEVLTLAPAAPRVWRNDGATFSELPLGLTPAVNLRAAVWVDFDNDGDLDIHSVNRGTVATGNEPDVLWRNDAGTFEALTDSSWTPGRTRFMSDGPVWGDIDRDGDLDALVQEGFGPIFFTSGSKAALYRNDGPTGHWLVVKPESGAGGMTPVGTRVTAWMGSKSVTGWLHANSWRGFQSPREIHLGLGDAVWIDTLVVDWPYHRTDVFTDIPVDQILRLTPGVDPTGLTGGSTVARIGPIRPQPARHDQWFDWISTNDVHVRVVDVSGRTVRNLGWFGSRTAIDGRHRVVWDGRDDRGAPVAGGVYFLRGEGRSPFTVKAVRLR